MSISNEYEKKYNFSAIGIDEAGRGPLAGPVVACALLYNYDMPLEINDSKQLTERKREQIYEEIVKKCKFGIGIVDALEIDAINILRATELAMQRAYNNLLVTADIVLIDGNINFHISEGQKTEAIVKGDSKSITIAAASIVAKVTRDRIMQEVHLRYPLYQFDKHKGYPTRIHIEMIGKHGPIPNIHRETFAPVRKIMELVAP